MKRQLHCKQKWAQVVEKMALRLSEMERPATQTEAIMKLNMKTLVERGIVDSFRVTRNDATVTVNAYHLNKRKNEYDHMYAALCCLEP